MNDRARWDAIGSDWARDQPHQAWRAIHNAITLRRMQKWWRSHSSSTGRVLKTDLFDEMAGADLLGEVFPGARRFGTDVSVSVAAAAVARSRAVQVVVADARSQALASESLDLVLSNSTLDHFDTFVEVETSLLELHRLLRPGGELLLTMDNAANPVVALRNGLPFGLLTRIGLVPYPVGATAGPKRLVRALEAAGFEVLETGAIGHFPRVFGVWLAALADWLGWGWLRAALLRVVLLAEVLDRLPTRYLTGYFVALRARRPASS